MKIKTIISSLFLLAFVANGVAQNPKSNPNSNTVGVRLPRIETPQEFQKPAEDFLNSMKEQSLDLHSIMVLQHGKVIFQKWLSDGNPDSAHILNSVSKTFTSIAIGKVIEDGKLALTDKLVDLFPEYLPKNPSENLKAITVRDLLTMTCGHNDDHTYEMQHEYPNDNWIQRFMSYPVEHKPGEYYCYNSVGTFMLSAIVQKITGQTVLDYLTPRLFEPLGIQKPRWDTNSQGICFGGWGLYLKTEDLAKVGQLILQKGKWNGKQLLSEQWVNEMTKRQTMSRQAGMTDEQMAQAGMTVENSDWMQGYGYQMWRCRYNCVRADGARGQYILVMPDFDAVIAMTAMVPNLDMQKQLAAVWKYIMPYLNKNA